MLRRIGIFNKILDLDVSPFTYSCCHNAIDRHIISVLIILAAINIVKVIP